MVENEPRRFLVALQRAGWRTSFLANRYTFEELQSTGDLALPPLSVPRALYRHHHANENTNQSISTMTGNQLEYYRRFAGLLAIDQVMLSGVDDADMYEGHDTRAVTADEAIRAYRKFTDNAEAIAWLPWLQNTHVQSQLTNTRYQRQASELLDVLKATLAQY